jgi:DNA-binding beta-propeller fold protein YncE
MKKSILFIILSIIILSCSQDEKIINNTEVDWKLLVARGGSNPVISLIDMPESSELVPDIIAANNDFQLTANVSKIKEYGGLLYILLPTEYKILVIGNSDFKKVTEYDFSADKLEPSDICFLTNGTTAYVSHGNDSAVTVLDIFNKTIAKRITCGKNPVSVSCSGNQIITANQGENTISIIDSRTNELAAKYPTYPYPSFVQFASNGYEAVVVCLGSGKLNPEEVKSPAMIIIFDIEERAEKGTYELGYQANQALTNVPADLGISASDWAFIPTNNGYLRFDIRRKEKVLLANRNIYSSCENNIRRKEMLSLRLDKDEYLLAITSNSAGSESNKYKVGINVTAFHPL